MEYFRHHSTVLLLPIAILLSSSSCHALLDHLLKDTFSDAFSHHIDSEDDRYSSSCDFESLCLWTLSNRSEQSDWSVVLPEQSELMPVSDHSVGTSEGHFLVLSASPAAETSDGCEYHLTSPILPASNEHCLLHMALYESTPAAGNFSLLIKPLLLGSAQNSVLPFPGRGNGHRAEWEVVEAVIGKVDEPFQVTVLYSSCLAEGRTVALDSLELRNCEEYQASETNAACGESFYCEDSGDCIDKSRVCDFHTDCPFGEDEGFICGALPFGSYCSFELDECGWSVSSQHSQWRRVSGDQLEKQELLGVTLQRTPGHFLFLQVREGSPLRQVSIYSPSFPAPVSTNECQMHFSLYLYGDFNGTLVVAIEENGTANSPLVWERNGQGLDDWDDVALQLTGILHRFQVMVTAVWARGSNADIALDYIALGAACFDTDVNSLLPPVDLEDFLSPLPEPSASEVSLMTWFFNSCGASGPHGPTQAQCDNTYRNKNISVTVGKEGSLKGVQMWRVPATNRYLISAYGAAGGKGAKNHNKHNHGVFISAIFPLEKGDTLHILVGHQGEDACPGRNPLTQKICLGESSVIEDNLKAGASVEWAGGGGGGGGATYIFKKEEGELVPLLIAAGGGGKAYLEDPESSLDQIPLEQFENTTTAPSTSGQTGAAGGGGGWSDSPSPHPRAGQSLVEGAVGGSACPLALSKLSWSTYGGFGGGGGACTTGGGGGGYRGGDAALMDELTADGQSGISFIHPMGEIFLQPLAVMESHGECEIKVQLNCSHCQMQSCKQDEETHQILCLCHDDEILASDNVTCISAAGPQGPIPQGQMSMSLILAVVASTIASGIALICAGVILSKRLSQFCVQSVPSTFHRL